MLPTNFTDARLLNFKSLVNVSVIISLYLTSLSGQTTYTYPVSTADFLNPERGFYYPSNSADGALSSTWVTNRRSAYTPWQANYQVSSSLFFRYFMLSDFINSSISTAYLQAMEDDFAAVRTAGSKLIIRFSYTNTYSGGAPYGDASKAQVLAHIQQLAPVLQDNADVIAAVQMGFIGTWGEGYYTDYFGSAGDAGSLNATNWQDRNDVLQALLNAVPTDRMVQVRYPQQKQKFLYGVAAPTTSSASGGRIGHHNDCLLASNTDFGTFTNYDPWSAAHANMVTDLRTYKDNDAETVVVGGETCFGNTETPADIQCATNGGRADTDLALFNYSYLNADYNNASVNNNWTGTCLEDIKRNLGYRFELVTGTFPDAAQAGQQVNLQLNVRNVGYAPPFNPRNIEYILRNTTSGQLYYVTPNTDPQNWGPGNTTDISQTFCLPVDIPNGSYELLLHLPDPYTNLYERPEYAIRFASQLPSNADVWESATGYNQLGHTLTINSTAAGISCSGQSTFSTLSTLPVEWLSFNGMATPSGDVALHWKIIDSPENAGFTLERSLDGQSFQTLDQIPAMTDQASYDYLDDKVPAVSTIYYRIQQRDLDGATGYSPIVKVHLPQTAGTFVAFPNPSTGQFFLRSTQNVAAELRLYHSSGQLLWTRQEELSQPLELRIPKAGIYWLEIRTGQGKKVIKIISKK